MLFRAGKRCMSTATTQAPRVKLKHLPYELGSLEPVVSGLIMDLHYGKHHRTYVKNLNDLFEKQAEFYAKGDITGAVSLSQDIKFNGGGHVNHELFWDSMCPVADSHRPDSGVLHEYLTKDWGTIDNFITTFNARTAAIQGSGWGWLVYNKNKDALSIRTTPNQDYISNVNPNLVPILNIDIWEHAYYLDYKNARPAYLKEMWKIINW